MANVIRSMPDHPSAVLLLGQVVPVLPNARSVVMIEQVAGVFYVALVVARLVGLAAARARRV